MAKLELSEDTETGIEAVGAADPPIAVAVQVDAEQLRAAATQSVLALNAANPTSGLRTVVAFPGVAKVETPDKGDTEGDQVAADRKACASRPIRFLPAIPRRFPRLPRQAPIRRFLSWRESWV